MTALLHMTDEDLKALGIPMVNSQTHMQYVIFFLNRFQSQCNNLQNTRSFLFRCNRRIWRFIFWVPCQGRVSQSCHLRTRSQFFETMFEYVHWSSCSVIMICGQCMFILLIVRAIHICPNTKLYWFHKWCLYFGKYD